METFNCAIMVRNRDFVMLCAAGVVVLLRYPYPREVSEPVQYESIRVHAQIGQVAMESDGQRLSVSSRCKDKG